MGSRLPSWPLCGGGCEIRTHAPLPANGFQDHLVMTASITLRVSNWPKSQQIPKYEIKKIARKLRDAHLAKCKNKCEKPNKIKGFGEFAVIRTIVFQDRLVMTASIPLRIWTCLSTEIIRYSIVLEILLEMRFCAAFGVPKKSGVARLFKVFATAVLANFQDRLVMTASRPLRIWTAVRQISSDIQLF